MRAAIALRTSCGLGASLTIAPITALLVGSVPAERDGIASGVLNTCRQVGSALAVAVFGVLVAHRGDFPNRSSDQSGDDHLDER